MNVKKRLLTQNESKENDEPLSKKLKSIDEQIKNSREEKRQLKKKSYDEKVFAALKEVEAALIKKEDEDVKGYLFYVPKEQKDKAWFQFMQDRFEITNYKMKFLVNYKSDHWNSVPGQDQVDWFFDPDSEMEEDEKPILTRFDAKETHRWPGKREEFDGIDEETFLDIPMDEKKLYLDHVKFKESGFDYDFQDGCSGKGVVYIPVVALRLKKK